MCFGRLADAVLKSRGANARQTRRVVVLALVPLLIVLLWVKVGAVFVEPPTVVAALLGCMYGQGVWGVAGRFGPAPAALALVPGQLLSIWVSSVLGIPAFLNLVFLLGLICSLGVIANRRDRRESLGGRRRT